MYKSKIRAKEKNISVDQTSVYNINNNNWEINFKKIIQNNMKKKYRTLLLSWLRLKKKIYRIKI